MICDLGGFAGEFAGIPSQPDGQPRRRLDATLGREFGFKASMRLRDGLIETLARTSATVTGSIATRFPRRRRSEARDERCRGHALYHDISSHP